MGDAPATSNSASEYPTPDAVTGQSLGSSSADAHLLYSTGNNSTDSQLSSTPQFQHQYPGGGGHNAYASAYEMPQSQGPQGPGRGGAFNMNAMANALPQPGYRPAQYMPGAQRYNPAGSTPNMVAQMHSAPPYPGQGAMGTVPNQQYYMPQHAHVGPYYAGPMSPTQQQQGNMSPRTNMGYYPAQVIMNNQQAAAPGSYYYTQTSQYAPQSQMVPNQFVSPAPPPAENRSMSAPGGIPQTGPAFMYDQGQQQQSVQQSSQSNVVRGPPRKPKQSGHAIWIGNLPPATDLMSLVHHVCGEAEGLESLFLISKSNCAFANFKDEQSCVAAQQKLHDSKFQSVRLVSRLRKSTVEGASGVTAPTGPAASAPQQAAHHDSASDTFAEDDTEKSTKTSPPPPAADGQTAARPEVSLRKDKFFILKSLTVEDLDLSVRTGIWATQSHNERALNSAFKAADNVYLVFSANKSGEYFGYARMTSPMDEDPAAAIEFAPQAQFANDVDLPKAIPTEATEFAPRGRIIDDSSRGTIFWEAERQESPDAAAAAPPDVEETASTGEADDSSSVRSGQEGGESKAWGKPFKLEWMSTTRLPFYRTRGLRNPWNSNREVKIARDGTELEPSVGRRLISLFNRVQSPAPSSLAGPGMRHPHMQMMPGYHAGRPPYQQ